MITSVRLQNFQAHRDTTVPLGRLTVLVGPNGSGKTSVLEALRALAVQVGAATGKMFGEEQDIAALQHRGGDDAPRLTAEGQVAGLPWAVSFKIDAAGATDLEATIDESPTTAQLEDLLGEAVLHNLDPRRIAAGTWPQARISPVGDDGGNTAAVLALLKLADDERFDRILASLKAVVPAVERIRIRRTSSDQGLREQISLDLRGAPGLPAQVLSEGTLITLALLTSICAAPGPRLVLLDDLDHALHPVAQLELVRQLKRLLDEMPDLQIVATTHSPFVLDEVEPADVRVFALRPDGSAAVRSLAEHPEAGKMKGALSAGQIWTLDPEDKWVLARPSQNPPDQQRSTMPRA